LLAALLAAALLATTGLILLLSGLAGLALTRLPGLLVPFTSLALLLSSLVCHMIVCLL
jgi:hypothetical protein